MPQYERGEGSNVLKRSRRTRYPTLLHSWLVHAAHLARALDLLVVETLPDDPAFVWLLGRPEEVRLYVREVLRDYAGGELDADSASCVISMYLEELHVSLRAWFGELFVPGCCRALGWSVIAVSPPPRIAADTDVVEAYDEPQTSENPSVRPPMQSEASITGV
jgi:hypothetical protein